MSPKFHALLDQLVACEDRSRRELLALALTKEADESRGAALFAGGFTSTTMEPLPPRPLPIIMAEEVPGVL